jgi:hypothetical protein
MIQEITSCNNVNKSWNILYNALYRNSTSENDF